MPPCKAGFPLWGLNSIPLRVDALSVCCWTSGLLRVLATVDNAVVNMGVLVSLQGPDFTSFG